MRKLNKFGKAVKALGMASLWKDGDSSSFCWNWWHPLTWVVTPFLALTVVFFGGIKELKENHYNYGFGLSPYWKARKKERKFYENRAAMALFYF